MTSPSLHVSYNCRTAGGPHFVDRDVRCSKTTDLRQVLQAIGAHNRALPATCAVSCSVTTMRTIAAGGRR